MDYIYPVVAVIIALIVKSASNKSKAKNRAMNQAMNPNTSQAQAIPPRVQRLMERIQAQQAASQPNPVQGQFTRPAQTFPAGQNVPVAQPYLTPGALPMQPAPVHQPQQKRLPTPTNDLDNRIRKLMSAGNEVGAVRVLCDERDLNIIEAQSYARSLMAAPRPNTKKKPETKAPNTPSATAPTKPRQDEETRYVGSAAFAESIFDTDRDENVWASGWSEPDEPDDRTDITELWETVRNSGRATTT